MRRRLRIAISGACGKMGRRIASLALSDGFFSLCGAIEVPGHPLIEADYGAVLKDKRLKNVMVTTMTEPALKNVDVLIDFSSPSAVIGNLKRAVRTRTGAVIGTTGISERERRLIRGISKKLPVVLSPNMSIYVNILFRVVNDVARMLTDDVRVCISEAHHIHKKDAPSGTAKELSRIIRKAGRITEIPITSVRENEIVGDHIVRFETPFDTLDIAHHAKTRDIFAQGALAAARFVAGRKKGLYTMKDVLGLV